MKDIESDAWRRDGHAQLAGEEGACGDLRVAIEVIWWRLDKQVEGCGWSGDWAQGR